MKTKSNNDKKFTKRYLFKWILFCSLTLFLFGWSQNLPNADTRSESTRKKIQQELKYEDCESQMGVQLYPRAQKKALDPLSKAYREARERDDTQKMRELESQFPRPSLDSGESRGQVTNRISTTRGYPGEAVEGGMPGNPADWGTDIHIRSSNTTFRESHPAMATASDGTIYVVWENFGQSGFNGYLQIYYSTDGGDTWTAYGWIDNASYDIMEPSLAIGEGGQDLLVIAYVVQDAVPYIEVMTTPLVSGTGWSPTFTVPPYLSFWESYTKPNVWTDSYDWSTWYIYLTAEAAFNSASSNYNVVFWRSLDYGATWGTSHQVPLGNTDPDAWRDPDGTYGTTANNLYIGCFNGSDSTLYTLISQDYGNSWSDTVAIYTLPTLPVNPVDPDIEAAANYDNIQLCCTKSFSGNDNVGQTYSSDGGYTWTYLYSLEGYTSVNEFAAELTANEGGASWHVAYTTQDWWVYYSTRLQDLSNFWQLTPEQVNDIDWASAAYTKKAITSNWASDEAGIAWADFRDGSPDYDIYFDRSGAVSNDECATATVIPGPPYTDNVNTTLATPNPSDPVLSCGGGGGGNTVWYVYTPASSTWVSANTFGSDYDTVLGLFTGSCGSLVEESCNDDAVGLQSEIIWEAQAGVTYYILVAEYGGGSGGGNLVFNLDPATPPALYQGPATGNITGGAFENTNNFPIAPKTKVDAGKLREKLIRFRETSLAPDTKYLPEATAPRGSNEIDDQSATDAAPTLLADFFGIPDDQNSAGYSFIPPDPTCAAGPNHIMAATNTDFAIFDKAGNKLKEIDATQWFENVLPGLDPGYTEPFGVAYDPQIIYDHFEDRWVMIYIADDNTSQSYLLLSVSDDWDPNGVWVNYAIPANRNGSTVNSNLNDYPKLGLDQYNFYVTANMFDLGGSGFQYIQIRVIEK
ncbi:MAG: sialidase family protein, partial [Calditrichia bacterium]